MVYSRLLLPNTTYILLPAITVGLRAHLSSQLHQWNAKRSSFSQQRRVHVITQRQSIDGWRGIYICLRGTNSSILQSKKLFRPLRLICFIGEWGTRDIVRYSHMSNGMHDSIWGFNWMPVGFENSTGKTCIFRLHLSIELYTTRSCRVTGVGMRPITHGIRKIWNIIYIAYI